MGDVVVVGVVVVGVVVGVVTGVVTGVVVDVDEVVGDVVDGVAGVVATAVVAVSGAVAVFARVVGAAATEAGVLAGMGAVDAGVAAGVTGDDVGDGGPAGVDAAADADLGVVVAAGVGPVASVFDFAVPLDATTAVVGVRRGAAGGVCATVDGAERSRPALVVGGRATLDEVTTVVWAELEVADEPGCNVFTLGVVSIGPRIGSCGATVTPAPEVAPEPS